MRKNVKKEINAIIENYMDEIQSNFVDGKLNERGQQLITECTNVCLNLTRRCENDYRELNSETFYYNDKDVDIWHEKEIISYVSTKIYMQLSDLNKAPNEFIGISRNEEESFYNWKRKDTRKFVRYVDDFREEEGLVPLEITPDELFQVCSHRHNKVEFEDLFQYYLQKYTDEDFLLDVVKELFDERFYRIHKENQQFLMDWTKEQLHQRAVSNIQHHKIELFFDEKVRYTDCLRSTQMILVKICNN